MPVLKHKSLAAQNHSLSKSEKQFAILDKTEVKHFSDALKETNLFPLKPTGVDVFQINLGKMCNQVCNHCHVDAGPDRKEIMIKETMIQCLDAIDKTNCSTVDLTGGAPEMNPNFRWFVEELSKKGKKIIVRCNLTIIVANKKYNDLPEFFKKHHVEVVSSLPCYTESNTDSQRGDGVFGQSIRALQMLNAVGYGKGEDLTLNLVFNPGGASLPPSQDSLEQDYKKELKKDFDIEFDSLFAITNLPISRFLEFLIASERYEEYMNLLADSYNSVAAENVMCRNTISISWDGFIYDCDFNQILELKVAAKGQHLSDFNNEELENRNIIVSNHCYGCTAGAGSSCGGVTV
ncbi:MAG: arsenosugar biosynthesis radical SAM protein ArsS [Fluviicola sp.]|nr:arsenosugar biosynthesis radical SAM protein ArsS [Fluviicola sp.]